MLQARPRTVLEIAVFALPQLKQSLQDVDAVADGARAGERAEVAPRFPLRTTMKRQPWIDVVGQIDVRIRLVVAQNDVVRRPQSS